MEGAGTFSTLAAVFMGGVVFGAGFTMGRQLIENIDWLTQKAVKTLIRRRAPTTDREE